MFYYNFTDLHKYDKIVKYFLAKIFEKSEKCTCLNQIVYGKE